MNTKLKCLLLDDELPGLTYLKMLCEEIPDVEVVKTFNSPQLLLEESAALDFDLCIMDIEMPGMNGLQLAAHLKKKPVIFTTAYRDYAAEAFDLNAIDFVRKPVARDRLQQALQKARDTIRSKQASRDFVTVNTDRGKSVLRFEQICLLRTSDIDSRDKVALMADGSELTIKNISFNELEILLPGHQFARINRREVLSLKYVAGFDSSKISTTIENGAGMYNTLLLSDIYRPALIQKLSI